MIDQVNDPLFKGLLGKNLGQVLKELGFPGVPSTVFTAEDVTIFRQHMDKLPGDHAAASAHLVRSLHRGTVVAIQSLSGGKTRMTVDFLHLGFRCTVQLVHWHEQWETTGTPSVLHKKRKLALPVMIAGTFFAVAAGGLWTSSALGDGTGAMSAEDAIQLVEDEGYFVMTADEKSELVAAAEKNGYEQAMQELDQPEKETDAKAKPKKGKKAKDGSKPSKKGKKKRKKEIVFTMKEGMTSEDLIQALKEAGLIKDEVAFGTKLEDAGVATKVRPGKYTFSSDMSEKELIRQLR